MFDSNFLSRGLALYESLLERCQEFHLYVYAFDEKCFEFLSQKKLKSCTVISLGDFEDEALLQVKKSRSRGEYCWTCTPSVILHAIQNFSLDHCTYVDADIFFFNSPQSVLLKFLEGNDSVLITPHHYTNIYDQAKTSGVYCVQFVPFKSTADGLKVLKWWREKCLEWCYARFEDGKFGDQKYLDIWTSSFNGIHVDKDIGVGLAPWNVQQVSLKDVSGLTYQLGLHSGKVIFYHFHRLRIYSEQFDVGEYLISQVARKSIYSPYISRIKQINGKYGLGETYPPDPRSSFVKLKRFVKDVRDKSLIFLK